ncbi:MAG: nciI [Deltaproteobacteria bacterium RIFCSPLOWO2_12_FULL_43_16]|nr:MAG: nciI [Deltaproteobacteria bacterium GWA2_43_19]OGQ58267.1 MAG: nciI [Deltaproteobacteria bacterium RIFCSPLOWO2_12_FULL_43_16]HBR16843.1 nciI [Deltaproteobacteria bacterium]
MKLYTKEELIQEMREIFNNGWHKSVKKTVDTRNDGAVGNTLESLLHIRENNLPIPNTREWELKGQRSHTTSLITLKHIEPSPTAAQIVSKLLLPKYGWKHKQAGKKYPAHEMSFRSTTSATDYTKRGFKIVVDRKENKVKFIFDATKAKADNPEIPSWLQSVEERIGLGPLIPEPYWGFEDLNYSIGTKIKNCFYVVADSKKEKSKEFFLYKELHILSDFSFEKFLTAIEKGYVLIDFDARTGHNHGTKFRLKQGYWKELYTDIQRAI